MYQKSTFDAAGVVNASGESKTSVGMTGAVAFTAKVNLQAEGSKVGDTAKVFSQFDPGSAGTLKVIDAESGNVLATQPPPTEKASAYMEFNFNGTAWGLWMWS